MIYDTQVFHKKEDDNANDNTRVAADQKSLQLYCKEITQ